MRKVSVAKRPRCVKIETVRDGNDEIFPPPLTTIVQLWNDEFYARLENNDQVILPSQFELYVCIV